MTAVPGATVRGEAEAADSGHFSLSLIFFFLPLCCCTVCMRKSLGGAGAYVPLHASTWQRSQCTLPAAAALPDLLIPPGDLDFYISFFLSPFSLSASQHARTHTHTHACTRTLIRHGTHRNMLSSQYKCNKQKTLRSQYYILFKAFYINN